MINLVIYKQLFYQKLNFIFANGNLPYFKAENLNKLKLIHYICFIFIPIP